MPTFHSERLHSFLAGFRTENNEVRQLADALQIWAREVEYHLQTLSSRVAFPVTKEDNVSPTIGLPVNFYIDPDFKFINKAILRVRLLPFRAYSQITAFGGDSILSSEAGGAAIYTSEAGGDALISSEAGGSNTITSGASFWYTDPFFSSGFDVTNIEPDHNHTGFTDPGGSHNHGIGAGTFLAVTDGATTVTGSVLWHPFADHVHGIQPDGSHAHPLEGVNHTHSVIIPVHSHQIFLPVHDHKVFIDDHVHLINIPPHTHSVVPDIVLFGTASGCTIWINGVDRTNVMVGATSFSVDKPEISIPKQYLIPGFNTIEIKSSTLGRIGVDVYLDLYLRS